MYHDRTAWRLRFFVGKKYGCSKGYPQRNAAHVGSFSLSARPRTQHDCHHDRKVKPEAATAVIKLLMMSENVARNM
jgi:hypothetical protein